MQNQGFPLPIDTRPGRFLARAGRPGALGNAVRVRAGLLPAALRQVVRGRQDQSLLQRRRPMAAHAGGRSGADLVSTEVDRERIYTRQDVYEEVNAAAAMLKELGVERGDRVLLYMPMVPEAVFTMLACARIGAVHSVVFGGFASVNLAQRIDDAAPKVIVCTDGGSRAGKVVPYKPLLDRALGLCKTRRPPWWCSTVGWRPSSRWRARPGLRHAARPASGRAGAGGLAGVVRTQLYPVHVRHDRQAQGVQRDTGGYAVALASSMEYLFSGKPGDTYFCTSDIGWVVGHSYIIYGPLIGGQATILYEGTPVRPDGAILWKLVEKYRVNTLFSAPTAVRVLKRQDPALLKSTTCPRCAPYTWPANRWTSPPRNGSPRGWASPSSTTTGRPNRAGRSCRPSPAWKACRRVSAVPRSRCMALTPASSARPPARISVLTRRAWSPSCRPCRRARCPRSGATTSASSDLFHVHPRPPGLFDLRLGLVDEDGYWFILGRTDDVINVAGHRLGTREIEESVNSHAAIAECAVVGVADALRGRWPWPSPC